MTLDARYVDEQFCYLTTVGRVSGKPHEIEIWFGIQGTTLYMLSGGRDRSDWVKNIGKQPAVQIRIGDRQLRGTARIIAAGTAEEALARRLLQSKYQPGYGRDLSGWARSALPVAVELDL